LRAEKARRNLHEFVKQAWPVLEPSTPFVNGIHVEAICAHLQAVTEGRVANLIINVPPGHAKSLLAAVFWPAWVWIDAPQTRWLFASYAASLSVRDSLKCRRLIESEWYQQNWGHRYQLTGDQNQKHRFENDRTGYRIATSVGGSATGERADVVVVDDPHSVDQAESDAERRTAVEWFNGTMSTRLNDFGTGHKIVIQQRLHEADLTGDLLGKGGFEWLGLPAEFEPERRCTTSIGWTDPRQVAGELLWPDKVTAAHLEGLKVSLGSYRYAGQYQQRPAPAAGGIFQRGWWRFWGPAHRDLPPVALRLPDGGVLNIRVVPVPAQFDTMIQSWDMAFKDKDNSDYVVGQVWGVKGADCFLMDQFRGHLDMPATKEAVRMLSEAWPKAGAKLVEDKANGPAVIQELRHHVDGLIEVQPDGGKIARAHAVSPIVESGNVYLPHPSIAPWVEALIEETAVFPHGRHDDQVDALTQALNRLRQTSGIFRVPESQIVIDPFTISPAWPRAFGMAIQPHGVAALWGARDEVGRIYLYAEHQLPHAEPSENARAIRRAGSWIPGVLSAGSLKGSNRARNSIAQIYREAGLKIYAAHDGEDADVYQLWQMLANNQIRIFASLAGFLGAYRTGDEEALLLLCCQALVRSRAFMRTQPVRQPRESDELDYPPRVFRGPLGWMA
jgi:predicted phage terminase large subunit-like protein